MLRSMSRPSWVDHPNAERYSGIFVVTLWRRVNSWGRKRAGSQKRTDDLRSL